MSTNNASSTNIPQPTSEELSGAVTGALDSIDTGSTETVQNLTFIQNARLSRLKRNLAAVKQAGGSAATLQQAENAVKASTQRSAQLSVLHQQSATPAPTVSATGWVLQGRVFNASLAPAANLTVFLVDGSKVWQSAFGFAYTDSTGYFLINYAGDSQADSSASAGTRSSTGAKKSATSKSKSHTAGASSTTAPAGNTPSGQTSMPDLFIEIANASGKPIYLGTTAFSPSPGSVTYQNINLSAGEKPIGDPPASIRSTAIPKPRKK